MNYVFKTECHPEATGVDGLEFEFHAHTDEGGTVTIRMGHKAFLEFAGGILRVMVDFPELQEQVSKAGAELRSTLEPEE